MYAALTEDSSNTHSLHTNCISNSAILHNTYISMPTCEEKMASQRKP